MSVTVPGATHPESPLGRLGFLYASNPMQDSVSGASVLGGAYLGGALYEAANFGSVRTSDPDPRSVRGEFGGTFGGESQQFSGEAAALLQTGGLGTHASK